MQFGPTKLTEAQGAILAHSLRFGKTTFKKGRRLSPDDIAALHDAGHEELICARLEPGDVLEDAAADRLSAAVRGLDLRASAAFTGRSNLYAELGGLVVYDPDRLDAFNQVDEAITLGVVPPYQVVGKGQMVATLKIIPFALPNGQVSIAEQIASAETHPMIRLAPFVATDVALVQSHLPGMKVSILDSTCRVTEARLTALGSSLSSEARCVHDEAEIAAAVDAARKAGAGLVLVSGASAVVDRRDVVPAAIERLGGEVTHFGMPVDPGNLMLMGQVEGTPVIGMPGCARSPKLNGFDWVLQRYLAHVPVDRRDVMRMGPGGLLKDIPSRPLPRAKAQRDVERDATPEDAHTPARAPRIAALILAAGQSRRMGRDNKLLAEIDGIAMVRRSTQNILAAKISALVVVTGHEADAVRASLDGLSVGFAHNPDFDGGLSTSLNVGIAALPDDIDGVMVCLGDMPRVTAHSIDRLIAAYDPDEGRAICVPTRGGKRGNPVLWDRRFFAEMTNVQGDVGARHLIGQHDELVVEVEMAEDGVLIDVDTPDALAKIRRTGTNSGTSDR